MRYTEQSDEFQEQPDEQPQQQLQWFMFPCNVIPFRYDPEQGGWLYVHVMQLMDDERVDALHAAEQSSEGGMLLLGYPRTAAHDLDHLKEWVYIHAPLQRYLDLSRYDRGLYETHPDEQRRLQESYRVFVQTLNFEGMPYRDKRYLLAKHRQFQRRLAKGYYEGLH
jgi:hypothetical protein